MEQTVTAKVKIVTTADEKKLLLETMEAYRLACNQVSSYIWCSHDLTQRSIHRKMYGKLRAIFGLKSQMACSVILTVIAKYQSILTKQKKWIRPSFKKPQLDLVWNRDYSLLGEKFSVNTLNGRVKLPFHKEGMEKYFDSSVFRFGTAKLLFYRGEFYLHISVTSDIPETDMKDVTNVVGIDRGINFITATYDSDHRSGFVSGRKVKQVRSHYKALRKELQQVRTPSSRRRLKAIGQRENRFMQDVNHCIAKALVEENPVYTLFVLEDLSNVRTATEKVRVKDRYVTVSWSFYDLEKKLKYKAERKGQKVINVDPRYTSQTCPVCGHTEKTNRDKKMHAFCCRSCGYRSNDDRIGAMNLQRMGTEYLLSQAAGT